MQLTYREEDRRLIGRRPVLGAIGAGGIAAVVGSAASSASAAPLQNEGATQPEQVFLDYTQDALDAAYNQLYYAPEGLGVVARYSERSAEVREGTSFSTHAYGGTAEETLDFFPAASADAPTLIFIHGGEWRSGKKEMYSFLAPLFLQSGINFVSLDFASIPTLRLPGMADQVASAIEWVYQNGRKLGGDPHRIFVAGHSSGAHLAAVMATREWRGRTAPRGVIKGAICVGGMYDLYPVLLSYRREYVLLSDSERDVLSPAIHIDSIGCPVLVAYGTKETPEFQRQASAFAASLRRKTFEFVPVRDANHFEALLDLANPQSRLARAAVDLILSQA